MINAALGQRAKQSTYSYSDILLYWIYANLCGATRLESCMPLKNKLGNIPNFKTPSSDRLSAIFRELALPKETETTLLDVVHEFCYNPKLIDLMLDIAKRLKIISTDILDYDNVVIETEKYDASLSYKMCRGYQPAVGFMGQTPVFIEGRNGNTGASYKMAKALGMCFENLERRKIHVRYFRSDSAAYQHEVIQFLESKKVDFFIRVKKTADITRRIANMAKFKPSDYLGKEIELAEIKYTPFKSNAYYGEKKSYRVIVKRERNGETYAIITNNKNFTPEEVLRFYNNRACMERNFDDLKNNFNWKRLPFSYMNENFVFMIISAIANIIYRYIINKFGKKLPFLKNTFRLKKFIDNFIIVGSEWIEGRLKLYDFYNRGYILLSD